MSHVSARAAGVRALGAGRSARDPGARAHHDRGRHQRGHPLPDRVRRRAARRGLDRGGGRVASPVSPDRMDLPGHGRRAGARLRGQQLGRGRAGDRHGPAARRRAGGVARVVAVHPGRVRPAALPAPAVPDGAAAQPALEVARPGAVRAARPGARRARLRAGRGRPGGRAGAEPAGRSGRIGRRDGAARHGHQPARAARLRDRAHRHRAAGPPLARRRAPAAQAVHVRRRRRRGRAGGLDRHAAGSPQTRSSWWAWSAWHRFRWRPAWPSCATASTTSTS